MKRLMGCFLLAAMIMRAVAENEKTESYSKDLVQRAEGGDAQAQYNLGMCFFNGEGTKSNDIEAIKWLTKAGDGGLPKAQCELGLIYSSGEGVNKDFKKAFEWYEKAAEKDDPEAQTALGGAYFAGRGVAQNYTKAVEWYKKAAENGDSDAQGILGVCYAKGNGVTENQNEARKWLEKSAQQGNGHSKHFLQFTLNPKNPQQNKNTFPIGETATELEKRFGVPKIVDQEQQALQFEKDGYEIKAVMRSKKSVLITFEKVNGKKPNEEDINKLLREISGEQKWNKAQESDINNIYEGSQGELADYNKVSGALTITSIESMKLLKQEPISLPDSKSATNPQ